MASRSPLYIAICSTSSHGCSFSISGPMTMQQSSRKVCEPHWTEQSLLTSNEQPRPQYQKCNPPAGANRMKWITRERVKVDRVACPWLIKKFVDKDAEFFFVPTDKVSDEAKRLDAIPYDVKGVELGHHGKECSFEAIVKKYKLVHDPALVLLVKVVDGAA